MLPRVIIHNSISLDGSFVNFEVNMGLHYKLAGDYKPDIHLIGSNTITKGVELYGGAVPPENVKDFEKPDRNEALPYWVIIDSKGICQGLLHTLRSFEFCKDVVVLVSETTPEEYRKYLKDRNYDYHIVGKEHIDIKKALQLLAAKYNAKTILTDTGRILSNILLNEGLVNEISLLVCPVILGEKSENMFRNIKNNIEFKEVKCEVLDSNYIWLVYKIKY